MVNNLLDATRVEFEKMEVENFKINPAEIQKVFGINTENRKKRRKEMLL